MMMLLLLVSILIFGPSMSFGLSCYTNSTTMIDCHFLSNFLAHQNDLVCLLVVQRENLSTYTYQDCSISTSKSQASSSCQLQELSRPGKMWICKCSTTGCNNVTSMVNLLPSFSETPPPLPTAIDVTTMTTDSVPLPAAGVLKSQRAVQPYGHRQSVDIAVWVGAALIVTVLVTVLAAFCLFLRWKHITNNAGTNEHS